MWQGSVVSIHIAPSEGERTVAVDEIRAVPGRGLEGDRYFHEAGKFSRRPDPSREVTLIELETIEALSRDYDVHLEEGESRRNIVTRGVALNHLVGHDFTVGEATLRGLRLCEPCSYLEGLTNKPVRRVLKHRGGLRAQILDGGLIRPGDAIRPADA